MKINKFMMLVGLAVMASLTITSCKVDEPNTNPLDKQGVNLVAFGPNPVARGGYMRFMGTGMNQITSITLAGQELTPLELVSNEEVKVLIPQDAKIGDVVLKTAAGEEIVGKRQVTYTEPVGFDAEKPFEPATIKAGQDLTINGEYLNLVTKVILPNDIEITNFKEKDRKHIVIANIPAEAQTGKVILSFVATGDTIAQEIPSEAKLDVVLPTVNKVAELEEIKGGQVITIAGKNLDLVTAALSTTGDSLEFKVMNEGAEIDITMPEVVMNGTVNVLVASGIKIPVATIGVALPKVTSVEGATDVREGSVITINGTDLAIISGINFVDIKGNAVAAAAEGLSVTDTKVTVALPAAAVTGSFTILTTANINIDSTLFKVETLKPAVTDFNPTTIAMGGTVAVNGTDLDLVKTVTLTGGAVLTPADVAATTFNITIPYAEAETGKVTLTMANGETVTPDAELTIDAPLCCYATAWPDPEVEIKAGTMMVITVANIDKLTGVKIDGQDCQIIKLGDQLYIAVPDAAGKSSVITLVSENGSIDYPFAFIPNTEQKRSLWKGALPISWSDEGKVHILASAMADVPVGAELVLCYTQVDQVWGQAQVVNGNWGKYPDLTNPDGTKILNGEGALVPTDIYGWFSDGILYRETPIVLTDELLTDLRANLDGNGNILHIQGQDLIFNEIYVRWTISLETTLATGPFIATGWGAQPTVLGNGELANAKAGQILRMYITPIDGGYWQVQLFPTDWSAQVVAFTAGDWDLAAHNGAIEIVLTDEIIAKFQPGIVLNGDLTQVDKITLE